MNRFQSAATYVLGGEERAMLNKLCCQYDRKIIEANTLCLVIGLLTERSVLRTILDDDGRSLRASGRAEVDLDVIYGLEELDATTLTMSATDANAYIKQLLAPFVENGTLPEVRITGRKNSYGYSRVVSIPIF